jgi:hypothetical protein
VEFENKTKWGGIVGFLKAREEDVTEKLQYERKSRSCGHPRVVVNEGVVMSICVLLSAKPEVVAVAADGTQYVPAVSETMKLAYPDRRAITPMKTRKLWWRDDGTGPPKGPLHNLVQRCNGDFQKVLRCIDFKKGEIMDGEGAVVGGLKPCSVCEQHLPKDSFSEKMWTRACVNPVKPSSRTELRLCEICDECVPASFARGEWSVTPIGSTGLHQLGAIVGWLSLANLDSSALVEKLETPEVTWAMACSRKAKESAKRQAEPVERRATRPKRGESSKP